MQRSYCYNESPKSVVLYNRDIHNDKWTPFVNDDSICSLHRCTSTTVNEFCFVEGRNDVSSKTALSSMVKKHEVAEKSKSDNVVVAESKPQQVVYKTALQAFIQRLLLEQTCGSSKKDPVVDDFFFSMLNQQQLQSQRLDHGSIPDLHESYTSCDLTATEHSGDHDDYRYDSTTTLGGNDDDHVKYIDLPPLIDISLEMRSFM